MMTAADKVEIPTILCLRERFSPDATSGAVGFSVFIYSALGLIILGVPNPCIGLYDFIAITDTLARW
jgi:hypothetical protein